MVMNLGIYVDRNIPSFCALFSCQHWMLAVPAQCTWSLWKKLKIRVCRQCNDWLLWLEVRKRHKKNQWHYCKILILSRIEPKLSNLKVRRSILVLSRHVWKIKIKIGPLKMRQLHFIMSLINYLCSFFLTTWLLVTCLFRCNY